MDVILKIGHLVQQSEILLWLCCNTELCHTVVTFSGLMRWTEKERAKS